MNMTDSFTPSYKNRRLNAGSGHHWLAAILTAVLWCCGWVYPSTARAQQGGEASELRLEPTEAGLFLSAALRFELPTLVEDALNKGIPLFFVMEAEVLRERWYSYWYQQPVGQAARYMRLSYQPLTRRWRLAVSATPLNNSGLGVVLGQNHDALADALAAMQRISQWKIAEVAAIEPGLHYNVNLRFRLDMSQLPRPLQIGAMGRSEWNLSISKSQRLFVETSP